MDEYEIDRAFSEDAEEIETLRARVAELEDENGKLKTRDKIRKAAVDRWVPCSGHRDKINPGYGKWQCQVCRAEQAEAKLAFLADSPPDVVLKGTRLTDGANQLLAIVRAAEAWEHARARCLEGLTSDGKNDFLVDLEEAAEDALVAAVQAMEQGDG